jgi:hypothetical protein
MINRQKITVTFEVIDDDMPSERRAHYRQAMIDAMSEYRESVQRDIDEFGRDGIDDVVLRNDDLIYRMLEDCNN